MKQKLKICDECKLPKLIWANRAGKRYCRGCFLSTEELTDDTPSIKQTNNKKTYKIPARSPKRELEEKQYSIQRKDFLLRNPTCRAKLEGCQMKANQVHHKMGRVGKLFLDESEWLPICGSCHCIVTDSPALAIELGLSKSRLSK